MCGICFTSNSQVAPDLSLLQHRGPDDTAAHIFKDYYFGHTRLSIIDLTTNSKQPFISQSGNSIIIFNGEIYNYKNLRQDLINAGSKFNSTGDTEVVINGLERYGKPFIHLLDGMYSFIWMDLTSEKVIVARDILGKMPLYWHEGGYLVICSEIRPILSLLKRNLSINPNGLTQYIRYGFIPEPDTIWKDIQVFPSGLIGEYDQNKWKWEPVKLPGHSSVGIDKKAAGKKLRSIVIEGIEKRLVADVDVGVFLSGGIDSSLITGAITKELGQKPHTFSVTVDNPQFNEKDRIDLVVKKWQSHHTFIHMNENEILAQVPTALSVYDHPSIDGVNTFVVSQAVHQKGLKVALSGLGGDELFQGYPTFKIARQIKMIPEILQSVINFAGHKMSNDRWLRISQAKNKSSQEPMSSIRSLYSDQKIIELIPDYYTHWQSLIAKQDHLYLDSDHPDSKLISQEFFGYMKQLLIRDVNIMSMANSLEVRAPLTDRRLLDFVLSVPDLIKRPSSLPKEFLVSACHDLLIPEIVNAPKKGFVLPMRDWIIGPLNSLVTSYIDYLNEVPGLGLLYRFAKTQLQRLETNETTWTRVWQWVVLSKVLKDGFGDSK